MASVEKIITETGLVRYRARWRDPNGDSQEKWFRRSVDANRFSNEIEISKDRGTYVDPRAGKTPFREVAEVWQTSRRKLARSTQDRDSSYLSSLILPEFGDRQVGSIQPYEVEDWLDGLDRAPNTGTKALQVLRGILETARKRHLINVNPAAEVKPPGTTPVRAAKALTDEQAVQVLQAAEEVDTRCAVLVHLMLRCGLRSGEALALRRNNIDFPAGTIRVAASMSRREGLRPLKGRDNEEDSRTVPMPEDVAERLNRHLNEQPVLDITGFIVTGPRGRPLRYTNWRNRTWTRIADLLDFEVTPHDLRRTAATRLFVEDRWTPPEVQAFLGHRDARTTLEIYTKVNSKELPQPSRLSASR